MVSLRWRTVPALKAASPAGVFPICGRKPRQERATRNLFTCGSGGPAGQLSLLITSSPSGCAAALIRRRTASLALAFNRAAIDRKSRSSASSSLTLSVVAMAGVV